MCVVPNCVPLHFPTGEIDDENVAPDDRDWDQYWRLLFKKITIDDIKNFEAQYKGQCLTFCIVS